MRRIRVAAVVLQREDGAVLTVRKRGTSGWMNPGGKPEADETPVECAVREVAEELGLYLEPSRLDYLGDLSAPAANEADHVVDAWVFRSPDPVGDLTPAAEIEAVAWFHPERPTDPAPDGGAWAPLLVDEILPLLTT